MSLHNYYISNLISSLSIINIICFVLSSQEIIPENLSSIIYLFTRFGAMLILLVILLIEFHIRHEHPDLLPKFAVNNKIIKPIYLLIFYTGFSIFCLKAIIFFIFPIFFFSIWELPI